MKVVLWFLMMFMPLLASASSVNEEQLFHRLDSYIAQRSKFTQRKEAKLLRLKKQLHMTSDKLAEAGLFHQAAQTGAEGALLLHTMFPPVQFVGLFYHILSPNATYFDKK